MGGEWTMPNYFEYMYPERKTQEKKESFEDIRAHLLKRLNE